jgi:hypothetical protein
MPSRRHDHDPTPLTRHRMVWQVWHVAPRLSTIVATELPNGHTLTPAQPRHRKEAGVNNGCTLVGGRGKISP